MTYKVGSCSFQAYFKSSRRVLGAYLQTKPNLMSYSRWSSFWWLLQDRGSSSSWKEATVLESMRWGNLGISSSRPSLRISLIGSTHSLMDHSDRRHGIAMFEGMWGVLTSHFHRWISVTWPGDIPILQHSLVVGLGPYQPHLASLPEPLLPVINHMSLLDMDIGLGFFFLSQFLFYLRVLWIWSP